MSSSPYIAPNADLKNAPLAPPSSPVKAVLCGAAVDIGGSLVVGMVVGIVYGIMLVGQGLSAEQAMTSLKDTAEGSWFWITCMAFGVGTSVLGGFVCARMSRRSDYRLGFILAAISVTFGLVFGSSAHSLAITAGMAALTAGAVLLGTRLGKARLAAS
ncbi:MAG: hypothetical protein V4631_22400 [Pseudomonadota bacterium]